MTDWLSIGNEDLTNRPRANEGDVVRHRKQGVICTVERKISDLIQFGTSDNGSSYLIGMKGQLLPEWEHVQ